MARKAEASMDVLAMVNWQVRIGVSDENGEGVVIQESCDGEHEEGRRKKIILSNQEKTRDEGPLFFFLPPISGD